MTDTKVTLEAVIRYHIHIPQHSNSRGFFPVLCEVCHDHGRKGKRAGFSFDADGTVGYNCFNCGHKAKYTPHINKGTMPESMLTVLSSFHVPQTDWEKVTFANFVDETQQITQTGQPVKFVNFEPDGIELMSHFYRLTDDKRDDIAQAAIQYLEEDRGVDWTSQPFYLAQRTGDSLLDRWYGRVIIPVYKDEKLIFWQGRDLTGKRQKKYISADTLRDNVMYGYDQLFKRTDEPIYVVEGWFDAYHVEGIAVFGNQFTPGQLHWLSKSPRPKVIIPDKFGDGHILARQALKYGWALSLPDAGSCKDVAEMVNKYGSLYTYKSIRENTVTGFEAETLLGLYCSNKS